LANPVQKCQNPSHRCVFVESVPVSTSATNCLERHISDHIIY